MAGKNTNDLLNELAIHKNVSGFTSFLKILPDPDIVLRKQGKDISVYKELTSDSHLFSVMGSRRSGVRSQEWAIDRGSAKTRQSKIIEDLFKTKIKPFDLMGSILDAPFYGYAVMEVVWEHRDGLILPLKVVSKPKEWFAFDPSGELLLKSKKALQGEAVPPYKFLVARNQASYENPYGEKILSRCFWPVVFKKGGIKFWVTFAEKYGMPFLIGKIPRGSAQKETDALADQLEVMVQDAIAVIPDDSSVEIKEASGKASSADVYEKMVTFFNSEISKAVLGQTLTTEMGKSGSYAASQTHQEVRSDLVTEDKHLVEDTINTLIGWIWEFNFSGTPPTFTLYEEEDVDKVLAERDEILTKTGLKFTKSYYMKAYGFEEGDIDISETPKPAATPNVQNFSETPMAPKPADALDAQSRAVNTAPIEREILSEVMKIMEEASTYEEAIDAILGAYPTFELPALQNTIDRLTANSMILGGAEIESDQL
ncbi:MAG: DUF935 domain-containing protein [Sulfuricurvum sp.]|jgi:phage gp29-like protein|uniref:DUF935 domain-containing protein n=1 Tax=Sulfuricurvum sp. TaxID=2025608 RepID=UPI0025F7A489|nr:DUF935 family protein [Sulfuricurvum sp.]MCK9372589.1 DUF935 domain-containing protein [Sulfuricurvum sp.]